MIEHHVYWALVGARWVDPENFAKGPTHFFDGAPEHLREKLREDAQFRVAENYLLSGLGRHAPDEDVDLAVRSLFALSVQLGDKPYLMGDTPCGTDATAFGALAGILTPFFDSQLRERGRTVRQSRRLCRPHDAALLSGICLERAAAGGVKLNVSRTRCSGSELAIGTAPANPGSQRIAMRCAASGERVTSAPAGSPFKAASSASSSAIRASRIASAGATSAASNFCGMCCGQLVSQARS